jgi:hypothetical protein
MARSRTRSRSPRRRRSRSRSRDRRRRDRDEPPRNRSRDRAAGGPGKGLPGGKAAGNKAASSSNVPMTAPPILTDKDLEGKSQVIFLLNSVPDPDPLDPYVFGPPGSGSLYEQAKQIYKNLDFCCLVRYFLLTFLSLKTDVVSGHLQKVISKNRIWWIWIRTDEAVTLMLH